MYGPHSLPAQRSPELERRGQVTTPSSTPRAYNGTSSHEQPSPNKRHKATRKRVFLSLPPEGVRRKITGKESFSRRPLPPSTAESIPEETRGGGGHKQTASRRAHTKPAAQQGKRDARAREHMRAQQHLRADGHTQSRRLSRGRETHEHTISQSRPKRVHVHGNSRSRHRVHFTSNGEYKIL